MVVKERGTKHVSYTHIYIHIYIHIHIYTYICIYIQPIADRVAQNLEIISKNFQFGTRRNRILMGCVTYYLVLIVNPMGRILVRWKSCTTNLEILCHPICNRRYISIYIHTHTWYKYISPLCLWCVYKYIYYACHIYVFILCMCMYVYWLPFRQFATYII